MKAESIQSSYLFQGISLLLLFFIVPLQLTLRNPLMHISTSFLVSLQNSRTSMATNIFSLVEYFNSEFLFCFIVPFILNFVEPIRCSKVILFVCLSYFLSNFIAIVFQEYRPFWFSTRVNAEVCLKGYGNPSTELIMATVVLSTLAIEFFHSHKRRWFIYCFVLSLIILISFSFMYLGENFPHQVLASLFISFILVTLSFTFDSQLVKLANRSCHNYYKNRIKIIFWFIFAIVMMLIVFMIDQLALSFNQETPKLINYAVQHCKVSYNPNGNRNIHDTSSIFYIVSFVAGSLHLSKKLTNYWNYTNWWKKTIRFVISAGYSFALFYAFGKT